MKSMILHNGYELMFEADKNMVRLVITENGREYVCRKESFKNLETFLQTAKSNIFKGRLQLYKDPENVHVQVKGEMVGKIVVSRFQKELTELKCGNVKI
jgi:hypothetical protein